MNMQVRDSDGNIVTDVSDVKKRWKDYFKWLLNVDDEKRAELTESILGVMQELVNEGHGISVVRKTVKN